MALQKPLSQPPSQNRLTGIDGQPISPWTDWINALWRWVKRYPPPIEATLDPASVAANTSAEQTFTVAGLKTTMAVHVNKPSLTAGLVIGNARVSAADTLAITFGNLTGSPIDPPEETYLVWAAEK